MTITASQTDANQMPGVRFASGSWINDDTVAAFTISLGFRPRYVRVVNETSRDQMEWFEGMTDTHGLKTVAAGTRTKPTSNGITVTDTGFTMGLDTDVVVTDEQIRWQAWG